MAAPKNIYKVWIKSTEKFYSTNAKASWTSESWAMNAAFDASRRYGKSNIEIHIFPVTSAEVIPYEDYLELIKQKTLEASIIKAKKEEARRKQENAYKVEEAKKRIAELQKFINETEC
jgi:hypothetical protein